MTEPSLPAHENDATESLTFTRRQVVAGVNAAILVIGVSALRAGVAESAQNEAAASVGPRKVRHMENVWITMPDGVRIAARMWLPEDAEQNPVPALLEYIPYRKRDNTRLWDEKQHPYLASHGYACIRADIRGSGDSEGAPLDEYERQEQDDGVEIIGWIAKQPWCTGKVGMFGISWGGFSSLQVAARRPPALKAIITHCSTDDRYTDDAHYLGGAIVQDMFVWGSMHTTDGPRPPDPAIVGLKWHDMWRERLEKLDFYVANWMAHPHRDEFWEHGSVNQDYSQIPCAVYAVGGWVDAYSSAIPRMLAGLKVPRKGLIGPWGHQYPYDGNPGPAIDWLAEALRWWDYWLKDVDTGIMDEPMYRVWMQNETAIRGAKQIEGRWVAEESWPSPRIKPATHYINETTLDTSAHAGARRDLKPLQTVGITSPHWCPFNMDTELPEDQRVDDARSLTFDSAPFEETLEILGAPVAELDISVDKPVAFLAARLNELTPDGSSRRVTYGVLNLCHRDGHESPKALEPGKRYRIRLQLRDIAHVFKRGSRMRIALSSTYWPLIWPSPEAVTLSVYTGTSRITLPVRPPRVEDQRLAAFGPAFVPKHASATLLSSAGRGTKVQEWDVATRTLTIRSEGPYHRSRIDETGTQIYGSWREVSTIRDTDPTSPTVEFFRMNGYFRPEWDVRVETMLKVSVTKDFFHLVGQIEAFDEGRSIFSRRWDRPIARRLV